MKVSKKTGNKGSIKYYALPEFIVSSCKPSVLSILFTYRFRGAQKTSELQTMSGLQLTRQITTTRQIKLTRRFNPSFKDFSTSFWYQKSPKMVVK